MFYPGTIIVIECHDSFGYIMHFDLNNPIYERNIKKREIATMIDVIIRRGYATTYQILFTHGIRFIDPNGSIMITEL